MSGGSDFSTNFILEALRKIHEEKLTGFLSFPYEEDLTTMTFLGGEFVALDARTGRKYLVPFLAERGIDLGHLLAESTSAISVAELQSAQQATLEFVGRLLNRLADPAVGVLLNFQVRDAADISAAVPGVPTANLVLQFFDKWLESRLLPAMRPDPAAVIRVGPDHLQRVRSLALTPRQGYILARLQDGLTVRDFISSCGMPEEQVARDLLAFSFFGILSVGEPPRKARAPTAAGRTAPAAAAPAPRVAGSPPAEAGEGVPPELLAQVRDLAVVAEKGNLYEILDLDVRADTEEIKHRFVELTKQLHPDKFQKYGDPALLAQVDAIFAKISEANEVLKDPLRRSEYNEKTGLDKAPLHKTAPAPAPASESQKGGKAYAYEDPEHKAKQHFAHGKEALKNQKFHDAVEHFREAVRMMPDVAEYQFFLGRTLSMNPQRAKEAEERLKRALELKPNRVEILLELGRFYERMNLKLRAKTYYEQALKADPKNKEAMQALGIKVKQPLDFKGLLKLDLKDLLKSRKDKE